MTEAVSSNPVHSSIEAPRIRERLTDERVANLVSAIGNHEAKAITLLAMKQGVLYPPVSGLWQSVISFQGEKPGWVLDENLPGRYCRDSLVPIGLVARKVEDNSRTYGYIKTEEGENLGVPLAGLLLDFSRRHPDYSLQDIFGQTGSAFNLPNTESESEENKKRSALTRIKIFWQLVTSKLPINQAALEGELAEYAALVAGHLKELSRKKVIQYKSTKQGQLYVRYGLSSGHPDTKPPPLYYQGLPLRVPVSLAYSIFVKDPEKIWSISEVAEQVHRNESYVGRVLLHLQRNGYLTVQEFSKGFQSEINLTDEQREMLLEVLTVLDRFQNQDPDIIERGRGYASQIISNPSGVAELMRKIKEHSPRVGRKGTGEARTRILSIIDSNPQSTSNEIQALLAEKFGTNLSIGAIDTYIRSLDKDHEITFEEEKGVRRYKLVEKSE